MQNAKALLSFVLILLTVYLGVFFVWLILTVGCVQYVDQYGWLNAECGQDLMTKVIRITHAPLIALLIALNK